VKIRESCRPGESQLDPLILGLQGPQGEPGPPGPGTKTIAGLVMPDGSTAAGSGFGVSHDRAGRYTVSFPSGTWTDSSNLIPVVTNFHGAVQGNFTVTGYPDGSASFMVEFESATSGAAGDAMF